MATDDLLQRLRWVLGLRQPVTPCTSAVGLDEAIPVELVSHILLTGDFEAADLLNCEAVCRLFASLMREPSFGEEIWRRVCQARWDSMGLDPETCYGDRLSGMTPREQYRWAEVDGRRRLGTVSDLVLVESWEVKFFGRPPCNEPCSGLARRLTAHFPTLPFADRITNFPYRRLETEEGHILSYRSSTFGNQQRPFQLRETPQATFVQVDGIPEVKMVRRGDWGWQLTNRIWTASSMRHCAPPEFPNPLL